jgi:malate dehydrogenase
MSTVEMVDAIMLDKKRVLPCSVLLNGEYGVTDLYVGVPIKLGAGGVEQIIELNLTSDESAALKKSSGAVKELVEAMASIRASA